MIRRFVTRVQRWNEDWHFMPDRVECSLILALAAIIAFAWVTTEMGVLS